MKTDPKSDDGVRKRTPFSANRKRLQVDNKFPGFYLRWFNDTGDRIQRALEAGYEFVKKDSVSQVGDKDVSNTKGLDSRVSKAVGQNVMGQPIWAFLMKIPNALHAEDMAEKAKVNARVDEALRAGKAGGSDVQNRYGDVSLKRE